MMPQKLIQSKSAYFPDVKISACGNQLKIKRKPKNNPKRKTGVKPITIVPLIVVAESISAFKNTGIVPKIAIMTIDHLPNLRDVPNFKSIATNFEKDENVESNVDAADVIIIKLMTNKIKK